MTEQDRSTGNSRLKLLAGKRILIVDTEDFVSDEARAALEAAGVTIVGPTSEIDAALSHIGKGDVDAAIIDVQLDGETAFPVAERLLELDLPFIFAASVIHPELSDRFDGYLMSEKTSHLSEIATGLFGRKVQAH